MGGSRGKRQEEPPEVEVLNPCLQVSSRVHGPIKLRRMLHVHFSGEECPQLSSVPGQGGYAPLLLEQVLSFPHPPLIGSQRPGLSPAPVPALCPRRFLATRAPVTNVPGN